MTKCVDEPHAPEVPPLAVRVTSDSPFQFKVTVLMLEVDRTADEMYVATPLMYLRQEWMRHSVAGVPCAMNRRGNLTP
jgi:hypothetical protein